MEFRTIVDIPASAAKIAPHDSVLLVGSCFANGIGQRFKDNGFPATVNPFGTMYNPASVLHTLERFMVHGSRFTVTYGSWFMIHGEGLNNNGREEKLL